MSPVNFKNLFFILYNVHTQIHTHMHTLFTAWDNVEEDHSWLSDYYPLYSIHYPIYKILKILTVPAVFFFNYSFALKFVFFCALIFKRESLGLSGDLIKKCLIERVKKKKRVKKECSTDMESEGNFEKRW